MKNKTLRQIASKVVVAVAISAALFALQADAASPCPTLPTGTAPVTSPSGGFAIDGNLQANTPVSGVGDWIPGPAGAGGNVLGTNGVPLNPATTFHLIDPQNSASDNTFKGGLKVDDDPNLWAWVTGSASAKDDINNALIHFATDANGHNWVFFSADRRSTNGSSYIDFEFLQNTLTQTTKLKGPNGFVSAGPNCGRTVNDFLLTVSLTNGGSTASLCVSRWLASPTNVCGYDYLDASASLPTGAVFAAVNTSPISVPYGAFGTTTYQVNAFAEGGVDLTAMLANIDPCLSVGIKTILIKTKTSPSSSATIVDFMSPLQVNLKIGPTADAGQDQSMCATEGSATFNLNGTATSGIHPITSMAWSVASGTATIDPPNSCSNCTTLPATVHVSSGSATLRLTVTDSANCTKTDDVVLTIPPAVGGSETTTPVSCNGGSDGTVTVNVSGGTSPYSVTVNSVTHTNVTSSTIFTGLASGTYQASITDAASCSGSAAGVLVDQPAAITASETATPASCNGGSDGTVTVTVSGGTSPYSVTVNGATHTGVTSSTTFTGLAAGSYSASITDAHSCPGSAAAVPVGQPTAITASEMTTPASCNGGSDGTVTVNVSGGTSPYSVTVNGATHTGVTSSTTFNGLASGTYPATISDAHSCPANAAGVSVGQPAAIVASETTTPASCNGGSDGTVTVSVSGGTSPYSVTVNGATHTGVTGSTTFNGLASGTYPATISDAHSCPGSAAGVLVDQPAAIIASETTTPASCNGGSDGTVTVNVSGGTSPYSVTVNGATHTGVTTSTTFTGLATGTYPATVSDAHSCPGNAAGVLVGQPSALTLTLTQHCSNGSNGSVTATFGGGTGPYMVQIDSSGYAPATSPNTFPGLTPGSHTVDLQDANGCTKSAQISVDTCPCNPLSACTPPYPFQSANPRTNIAFSESEVLRAFIVSVGANCTPSQVQVFYNDEHALTLGIRQITVKGRSGTTTTPYTVTPLATNPGSATNPQVGSMIATGDQAGVDVSGRPIFPALFITDITSNPSSTSGDWQNGGTAIPPHAIFGTWKAAVKSVDNTKNPQLVTVTPDADPMNKNNWNLGPGSDPVPAGLTNQGYGCEIRWDVSQLGLLPGHTYRLYFMVHDGDQNKAGGDAGQGCAILTMPSN